VIVGGLAVEFFSAAAACVRLQNIAREVFVLENRIEPLVHVGRIDRDFMAAEFRRAERKLLKQALQNSMKPTSAEAPEGRLRLVRSVQNVTLGIGGGVLCGPAERSMNCTTLLTMNARWVRPSEPWLSPGWTLVDEPEARLMPGPTPVWFGAGLVAPWTGMQVTNEMKPASNGTVMRRFT
jgi:hypothetical protein